MKGERMMALAVSAALLALAGVAPAADRALPAPRRIHIARGLWWEQWRLHEAIARSGGAFCDASWDVFGSTQGYSGCGKALSDFPTTDEALRRYDLIVLTGIRAGVLSPDAQKRLCAWVEAGGGLLVLGGIHGFGAGGWHGAPLEAVLPVEVGEKPDLVRSDSPMALGMTPQGATVLGTAITWGERPRVYYYHGGLATRSDAQVWVTGNDRPLLLGRQAGRGRVAVCAATVCGQPASAQEALFCETAGWSDALAATLNWLMPARDSTGRNGLPAGDPNDPRLRELSDLSGLDVEGVLSATDGGRAASSSRGTSPFDRVRKLASPCGGTLHAQAVVRALADSVTPFGAREAEALFAAIESFVQGEAFRAPALAMVQTGNSGQTALGMRLLGRLRSPALRDVAAPVIVRGLDGLRAQDAEQEMGALRPPDGENEFLRLAAMRAALDSGDAGLLEALKAMPAPSEAAQQGGQSGAAEAVNLGDGHLALDRQLAIEALAARAVLGEPEAAPALVRTAIRHRLEYEALLDAVQLKWPRNVTPSEAARRQRQGEALGPRRALTCRLAEAVARLPATSYAALAGRLSEVSGEIAMETLMAALADRGEPLIPGSADALRELGARTLMPEIRALCDRRTKDAR